MERYDSRTEKAEDGDNQEVDVKGIDLTADLVAKAFDIFSNRLGFEPQPAPTPSERTSKLRMTNKESQSSSTGLKTYKPERNGPLSRPHRTKPSRCTTRPGNRSLKYDIII